MDVLAKKQLFFHYLILNSPEYAKIVFDTLDQEVKDKIFDDFFADDEDEPDLVIDDDKIFTRRISACIEFISESKHVNKNNKFYIAETEKIRLFSKNGASIVNGLKEFSSDKSEEKLGNILDLVIISINDHRLYRDIVHYLCNYLNNYNIDELIKIHNLSTLDLLNSKCIFNQYLYRVETKDDYETLYSYMYYASTLFKSFQDLYVADNSYPSFFFESEDVIISLINQSLCNKVFYIDILANDAALEFGNKNFRKAFEDLSFLEQMSIYVYLSLIKDPTEMYECVSFFQTLPSKMNSGFELINSLMNDIKLCTTIKNQTSIVYKPLDLMSISLPRIYKKFVLSSNHSVLSKVLEGNYYCYSQKDLLNDKSFVYYYFLLSKTIHILDDRASFQNTSKFEDAFANILDEHKDHLLIDMFSLIFLSNWKYLKRVQRLLVFISEHIKDKGITHLLEKSITRVTSIRYSNHFSLQDGFTHVYNNVWKLLIEGKFSKASEMAKNDQNIMDFVTTYKQICKKEDNSRLTIKSRIEKGMCLDSNMLNSLDLDSLSDDIVKKAVINRKNDPNRLVIHEKLETEEFDFRTMLDNFDEWDIPSYCGKYVGIKCFSMYMDELSQTVQNFYPNYDTQKCLSMSYKSLISLLASDKREEDLKALVNSKKYNLDEDLLQVKMSKDLLNEFFNDKTITEAYCIVNGIEPDTIILRNYNKTITSCSVRTCGDFSDDNIILFLTDTEYNSPLLTSYLISRIMGSTSNPIIFELLTFKVKDFEITLFELMDNENIKNITTVMDHLYISSENYAKLKIISKFEDPFPIHELINRLAQRGDLEDAKSIIKAFEEYSYLSNMIKEKEELLYKQHENPNSTAKTHKEIVTSNIVKELRIMKKSSIGITSEFIESFLSQYHSYLGYITFSNYAKINLLLPLLDTFNTNRCNLRIKKFVLSIRLAEMFIKVRGNINLQDFESEYFGTLLLEFCFYNDIPFYERVAEYWNLNRESYDYIRVKTLAKLSLKEKAVHYNEKLNMDTELLNILLCNQIYNCTNLDNLQYSIDHIRNIKSRDFDMNLAKDIIRTYGRRHVKHIINYTHDMQLTMYFRDDSSGFEALSHCIMYSNTDEWVNCIGKGLSEKFLRIAKEMNLPHLRFVVEDMLDLKQEASLTAIQIYKSEEYGFLDNYLLYAFDYLDDTNPLHQGIKEKIIVQIEISAIFKEKGWDMINIFSEKCNLLHLALNLFSLSKFEQAIRLINFFDVSIKQFSYMLAEVYGNNIIPDSLIRMFNNPSFRHIIVPFLDRLHYFLGKNVYDLICRVTDNNFRCELLINFSFFKEAKKEISKYPELKELEYIVENYTFYIDE